MESGHFLIHPRRLTISHFLQVKAFQRIQNILQLFFDDLIILIGNFVLKHVFQGIQLSFDFGLFLHRFLFVHLGQIWSQQLLLTPFHGLFLQDLCIGEQLGEDLFEGSPLLLVPNVFGRLFQFAKNDVDFLGRDFQVIQTAQTANGSCPQPCHRFGNIPGIDLVQNLASGIHFFRHGILNQSIAFQIRDEGFKILNRVLYGFADCLLSQ